jgi:hypothetical protein
MRDIDILKHETDSYRKQSLLQQNLQQHFWKLLVETLPYGKQQ